MSYPSMTEEQQRVLYGACCGVFSCNSDTIRELRELGLMEKHETAPTYLGRIVGGIIADRDKWRAKVKQAEQLLVETGEGLMEILGDE